MTYIILHGKIYIKSIFLQSDVSWVYYTRLLIISGKVKELYLKWWDFGSRIIKLLAEDFNLGDTNQ
jgi:hypothetical protein